MSGVEGLRRDVPEATRKGENLMIFIPVVVTAAPLFKVALDPFTGEPELSAVEGCSSFHAKRPTTASDLPGCSESPPSPSSVRTPKVSKGSLLTGGATASVTHLTAGAARAPGGTDQRQRRSSQAFSPNSQISHTHSIWTDSFNIAL
jgi:hypothetical protein